MSATKRKATGAHFTPPALARLVCERLIRLIESREGPLRVLDPACGDGSLLCAMADLLPEDLKQRVTLIGVENDGESFLSLSSRRSRLGCRSELVHADFLDQFTDRQSADVIIANPPYVRTQVLGAVRAQELAASFGLSGRVDLYQAFLVAMAEQLRPGGVLGVITSNRFLTTKGGMATRSFLRTRLELVEIIDLGDTRLFEAAVLPAVVFARKPFPEGGAPAVLDPEFIRVYQSGNETRGSAVAVPSILDCVRHGKTGLFSANGTAYRVTAGRLSISQEDARPWTMLTADELEWVARIDSASACRIGEVAKVRVGLKTTADSVFIRRDWNLLPAVIRPEQRHLRPLLSQEDAARWRPVKVPEPKRVLYTHEVQEGRRRPIRFEESSPTWNYLLTSRGRLESRKYVIDAGRAWYEIWVPQDPSSWSLPKVVFPDISPEARFFLDREGRLVDGNCDWITTHDPADEDLLLLILGMANSSLMARYHELAFQNRLYARRKRYLTQYVAQYPLPERNSAASRKVVEAVRELVQDSPAGDPHQLAAEVDRSVASAFHMDWPLAMETAG